MVQATKSEIDYDQIQRELRYDQETRTLEKNLKLVKVSLDQLVNSANSLLKDRKAKVIVKHGRGYYCSDSNHDNALENKFPKSEYTSTRRSIDGVTILDLEKEGEIHTFYHSPLGIWIVGEPEQKDGEAYCQITGDKISNWINL